MATVWALADLHLSFGVPNKEMDFFGENWANWTTRLDSTVDQTTQDALVVGALESRALSARDRAILEHRLPQVLSFIELVSPDAFEKDMMDLYQNEGEN